jgi:hypothetical protein
LLATWSGSMFLPFIAELGRLCDVGAAFITALVDRNQPHQVCWTEFGTSLYIIPRKPQADLNDGVCVVPLSCRRVFGCLVARCPMQACSTLHWLSYPASPCGGKAVMVMWCEVENSCAVAVCPGRNGRAMTPARTKVIVVSWLPLPSRTHHSRS